MESALLGALIFVAALLYSAVGHAGGSGYLAAMAFVGLEPAVMRPASLVLNVLVASIATLRFARAGHFSWRGFWPFVVGSVPLSFVGGAIHLQGSLYNYFVGAVLLFAAARMAWSVYKRTPLPKEGEGQPPVLPAIAWGGGIGLLSGLTGTGGGVFLSPLLLAMRWGEPRGAAGVSAAFILVNSLAGLAGIIGTVTSTMPGPPGLPTLSALPLPSALPLLAIAAVSGGLIGAELGSRWLSPQTLRLLLVAVLVTAALKLILT